MSCSCNDKVVDFCHKPKVSDWQLDIVRSMIKCLCKCGDNPVDVPSCIATFLTGEEIDGYPQYITYSKNGGPFIEISIYDTDEYGISPLIDMLKNESLTGFAFTTLDSIYYDRDFIVEFCGLNSDGSFATSVQPGGIKPTDLEMHNGVYPGPFNIKAEKNTLTFRPTDDVSGFRDFFYCLNNPTEAGTLTVESCAIIEVLTDPLPPLS